MPKIELNKSYNSSQIIETQINNKNVWTAFEGFQGSEVELFLKDKLEDSVVDFKYVSSGYKTPSGDDLNNVLIGLNAFGKEVCYHQVINANPTYTSDFEFQKIIIGAYTYNAGTSRQDPIQVNKSDSLNVNAVFKYILTGNLAGNTFNETSAQSITFKWFKDLQGTEVDNTLDTFTQVITPGENIVVDITKIFNGEFAKRYLGVSFTEPNGKVEIVKVFDQPFALRELILKHTGNTFINADNCIITNLELKGTAGESLSNYKLEYFIDNNVKNKLEYALDDSMSNTQLNLPLTNISEGAHDIYVRAVASGNLTSNYTQISFIYQKETNSSLKDAVAMITEVPDEILNCDLSKFFKVVTTKNLSGKIEIIALKSSNLINIININSLEDARLEKNEKYKFKEISLDLLSTDDSQKIDYTSYIEIPGNENTSEYLKILIKDGTGVRSLNYYQLSSGSVQYYTYKQINVLNPKEGSTHLQYTPGEIIGFSQINNGNLFTDLSESLDDSDGLQLETIKEDSNSITMTTFKVSPTEGVFKTPKKLLTSGQTALHKGAFSIEMLFKTYGVNDLEDKILSIGNIVLCPNYLFLNYEPWNNSEPFNIVNASRADFRKEAIQHIIITYDPNYKPSTYDLLYDKFFTTGSTTYTKNAESYPCLKIYVNGVINRIISVSSATICSENDFKLQIHPTNSNINFYTFRTYDKTLTYEEVKKNRISSLSKLDDKNTYYEDNDILYLSSDFQTGQLEEKSKILNTISLGKCINKFQSVSGSKTYKDRKVLLLVLPEGKLPPYYGNRKEDNGETKATLLVHYPKTLTNGVYVSANESGRLSGGKVKAQGSSAKKYMFHNTSYSKFTFTPESEFDSDNPNTYDYYKMPGDSTTEIKKLVGKVNYASSMQSHKEGSTKLFHDAYMSSDLQMDKTWMNGGRKAVLEEEFLYFFVNVPESDLDSITWDYFKKEDGTYNFEKCYFLGFQTWGSAKGDKSTSGYSDATPHYLMLEGADNDNAAANFKTPWASMQIWGNYNKGVWTSANSTFIEQPSNSPSDNKNYYHQFSGKDSLGKPDYLTGLLIKDETIVFDPGTESGNTSDKRADAWDIDFGMTEGDGYYEKGENPNDPKGENLFFVFEDKAKESVNRFAQFYNLTYTFDFSSLLYIKSGTTINGLSMELDKQPIYKYKLLFGQGCTITYGDKSITPNPGDIYRWEKAWPNSTMADSVAKWVPAGLYHNGTDWENLNIVDICNWYSNAAKGQGSYPEEYSFFADEKYNSLKAIGDNGNPKYVGVNYSFLGVEDDSYVQNLQACMSEAFKIIMHEFLDVEDVSYHQAFIKLIAGTDNRAKNTYFQIVGPIYTDKYTTNSGEEVSVVKVKGGDYDGTIGYIKEKQLYKLNLNGEVVTETEDIFDIGEVETKSVYYKKTGYGDNKIRLYQDDLDTIFKTDNNGQQVKPYYLQEPPYNKDLEYLWGDLHSGLFYNYDLIFTEEIKAKLGNLLKFATGNEWPDTPGTKLHDYFFKIQKSLPAVAYNHQSEIYYEAPQVFLTADGLSDFYKIFENSGNSSWKDFNNNKVKSTLSLSHGSCLESEIEYLRDRVLLLSTYTNSAKNRTNVYIDLDGGSDKSEGRNININTEYTSFIQHIYPLIDNITVNKNTTLVNYDPLLDYVSWNNTTYDYNKVNLVYNLAQPKEVVDMSAVLTISPLTVKSYWTNTDLYRTINIKSGTNAFSQLFTFPNASTVISQDSEYSIVSSERKEIKVIDYLKNIEHLVLQNASISTSSLDFTGCNRLKTLILGSTENNLTDSPEDTDPEDVEWYAVKFDDVLNPSKKLTVQAANASTGFQQIILPKSNSVEQIVLPNSIEVININYYPNLTRFDFDAGTKLVNLTIDGRNDNSIIEYILSNFIGTYTTNLEITNIPDNFWLTENTCRKITQIANVKMSGTIIIGDTFNKAAIDWTTKKLLVEKFGNIETGALKFDYTKINSSGKTQSVNLTGNIESSGPAPVVLSMNWNNVPIDTTTNKNLKIYYSIKTASGGDPDKNDIRLQDKYTPYLIIKEGLQGTYQLITTVYTTTNEVKTLSTTITVGFYTPNIGDFAYANGTFSKVCDTSLGLVGVVIYSKEIDSKHQDIRVLSANYSSTDKPLGPTYYAKNWSETSSSRIKQDYHATIINKLGLGIDYDDYIRDVFDNTHAARSGGNANGAINYDTKLNNQNLVDAPLSNTQEREKQYDYIRRASLFLNKLPSGNQINTSYIEPDDFTTLSYEGKSNFEEAYDKLDGLEKLIVSGENYSKSVCTTFTYALFPAFLAALYYEPKNLSGKGITYFGLGNWYVPDSREIERVIYYRINSTIENTASTQGNWNSVLKKALVNYVGIPGSAIFGLDAFNNIDMLGDEGPQVSSVGTDKGVSLTYGYNLIYDDRIGWRDDVYWEYYDPCSRDYNHKITPICRIVLEKP